MSMRSSGHAPQFHVKLGISITRSTLLMLFPIISLNQIIGPSIQVKMWVHHPSTHFIFHLIVILMCRSTNVSKPVCPGLSQLLKLVDFSLEIMWIPNKCMDGYRLIGFYLFNTTGNVRISTTEINAKEK